MYVVQVVQAGSGLRFGPAGRQHHSSNRSVSAEASVGREGLNHGVIHMPPPYEAPQASVPDALTCQPSRTAVVPWMRQIAVLMRTPDHHHHLQHRQQRLPPSLRMRCSPQDCSSAVLTAAAPSSTNPSTAWGEGPDPVTIYLPGADGTAESSPADPASAGLPNTPTVVSSRSNSLALKHPATLQHRQPGQLGCRPGSSGSRTLPTMLQHRGANSALQSKAPAGVPAAANPTNKQQSSMVPTGNLKSQLSGPMGFLPALQWGSNSTYWGSPIGGTLFTNPPVEETPRVQASVQHRHQQQQLSKDSGVYWGSPIGGTLYVNPPVEDSTAAAAGLSPRPTDNSSSKREHMYWGSPIGGTLFINPSVEGPFSQEPSPAFQLLGERTDVSPAAAAAAGANSAAAGVVAAAAAAAGSNTLLPGVSKVSSTSKTARLPFLPPFKWGDCSSSKVQWGSPIGGTLYINPQAPAEWHEGHWGSSGSGFGSSSGGSGNGSSAGGGGGRVGVGSNGSSSGVRAKQLGSAYASSGAGRLLPASLGLVKLGVGLMAAMAAAALAMYQVSGPAAGKSTGSSSSRHGPVETRSASPAAGAAVTGSNAAVAAHSTPSAGTAAAVAAGAAAAEASSAPAGAGFHEWMVQRLQSTLESFEAEQGLLKAELSVLQDMSAAHNSQQGVLGGFRRWLGSGGKASTGTASNQEVLPNAGAVSVQSAGVESGGRAVGMLAADVAGRVAEIHEQLDSISVLRAALSAELREHQQMLQKAEQQQQAAQERLAVLVGR